MFEMPHPGKDHRDILLVSRGDHLVVSHRSPRLNYGCDPCLRRFIKTVPERKECVRCKYAAFKRELGLQHRELNRTDETHLPGSNRRELVRAREYNCV